MSDELLAKAISTLCADHSPVGDIEIQRRFFRILRGDECCPVCGAAGDEPCLTWRGMSFLDGTRHLERIAREERT